jgi:transketolase
MNEMSITELQHFARLLRIHAIEMTHLSHESHIASALSIADVIAVLYGFVLHINSSDPKDPGRDRFILSKGHACSVLYAALAEKGFFPKDELQRQCQNGALLGGHVSSSVPGVEFSTGALGHGACYATGLALSAKKQNKGYGVYALLGNGECNEGSIWETAWFASQQKLSNLTFIIDENRMQAMGFSSEILDDKDIAGRWRSFGWDVQEVDGHNIPALLEAFGREDASGKPKCIIARTIKGKGVSFMENNLLWHYRDPQGEWYKKAMSELGGM